MAQLTCGDDSQAHIFLAVRFRGYDRLASARVAVLWSACAALSYYLFPSEPYVPLPCEVHATMWLLCWPIPAVLVSSNQPGTTQYTSPACPLRSNVLRPRWPSLLALLDVATRPKALVRSRLLYFRSNTLRIDDRNAILESSSITLPASSDLMT